MVHTSRQTVEATDFSKTNLFKYIIYSKNSKRKYAKSLREQQGAREVALNEKQELFFKFMKCLSSRVVNLVLSVKPEEFFLL